MRTDWSSSCVMRNSSGKLRDEIIDTRVTKTSGHYVIYQLQKLENLRNFNYLKQKQPQTISFQKSKWRLMIIKNFENVLIYFHICTLNIHWNGIFFFVFYLHFTYAVKTGYVMAVRRLWRADRAAHRDDWILSSLSLALYLPSGRYSVIWIIANRLLFSSCVAVMTVRSVSVYSLDICVNSPIIGTRGERISKKEAEDWGHTRQI